MMIRKRDNGKKYGVSKKILLAQQSHPGTTFFNIHTIHFPLQSFGGSFFVTIGRFPSLVFYLLC
jgi:hypothetical protein